MELSDSNDGSETVENYDKKPIMRLFKLLIGNEKKQNIVLTNSQLEEILQEEYHIELNSLHELEVDIYLSVMKQFLKSWPQWDELDPVIMHLKKKGDKAEIDRILKGKYLNLKEYLKVMIDMTEPMAKSWVKSTEESTYCKVGKKVDTSDVVMDISCTRAQLNQLIYKKPHPKLNNTIFNITDMGQSRIYLTMLTFNAILNWWDVSIVVNLNPIYFKRETKHNLKHRLINKKLNETPVFEKLYRGFQYKANPNPKSFKKSTIFNLLKIIAKSFKNTQTYDAFNIIYDLIVKDLQYGPDDILVSCVYRKNLNTHPYVRQLCTDIPDMAGSDDKYELYLEETISPMFQLYFGKVVPATPSQKITQGYGDRIRIECNSCNLKFCGVDILNKLQQHFSDCHQSEPDWQCTGCKKVFTMGNLANARWYHKC